MMTQSPPVHPRCRQSGNPGARLPAEQGRPQSRERVPGADRHAVRQPDPPRKSCLRSSTGRPRFFASNDDMAAATVATAHRHHIDIPRDLTVCGFDDTQRRSGPRSRPEINPSRQCRRQQSICSRSGSGRSGRVRTTSARKLRMSFVSCNAEATRRRAAYGLLLSPGRRRGGVGRSTACCHPDLRCESPSFHRRWYPHPG